MSYRYICSIPDDEAQAFKPNGELPETLKSALRWFLMATAARLVRQPDGRFHSSAMIHAVREIVGMRQLGASVQQFLNGIRRQLQENAPGSIDAFSSQWQQQRERVGRTEESFTVIEERLRAMAAQASQDWPEIKLENYRSNCRVEYANLSNSGSPARYVVIGGDILARGLTLNGLCSSWFFRGTAHADSLEQRARWFGRHRGFSDLVQVWLDADCIAKYREIQRMNQELRESLALAKANGLTPRQFIPALYLGQGLKPTGGDMGEPITKAGARYTLNFRIDQLEQVTELIRQIFVGGHARVRGDYLIRGISADRLLPILQHAAYCYSYAWKPRDFERLDRNQTWNVLLKASGDGGPCQLTDEITVQKAGRKGEADKSTVSLKSLYTPEDFLRDLTSDEREQLGAGSTNELITRRKYSSDLPPLLVIYPVELNPPFAQMLPGLAVVHSQIGRPTPGWRAEGIAFDPADVVKQLGLPEASGDGEAGEDREVEAESLVDEDRLLAEENV